MPFMNKQKELLDLTWKNNLKEVMNNHQANQNPKYISGLGLTLLVRIPEELHQNIAEKIHQFRMKYPNQFIYPVDRIHLTVIGLVQVQENLTIKHSLLEKLKPLIEDTIKKYAAFKVKLKGLNITSTSVFIQGYYPDNTLDGIRKDLISKIKTKNLDLNITHLSNFDLGYAWLTLMRFTDHNILQLLEDVKELRNYEFGGFTVKEILLVKTDKYFTENNTKVISSFQL